jgi:hypothetical protein
MTSSTKIVLSQADSISIGSSFERNLIEKTKEYLDLYAYDNAIFFAERLVSHVSVLFPTCINDNYLIL